MLDSDRKKKRKMCTERCGVKVSLLRFQIYISIWNGGRGGRERGGGRERVTDRQTEAERDRETQGDRQTDRQRGQERWGE